MKEAPLSSKQRELVDVLGMWSNSYISFSERKGFYLVLDGDVKDRVSASTVIALERKRVITKTNGKYYLCQNS